jgi:hypothetical protein
MSIDATTELETDPRVAELKQLRARRLALETQAEEMGGGLTELEREQRAVADAEALIKAVEEHGKLDVRIAKLQTDFGLVIIKRASANRYRKFQDDGEFKMENIEKLVRPCVVHPKLSEFDEWCEEQPAILTRASNVIARLGGWRKEEIEKK